MQPVVGNAALPSLRSTPRGSRTVQPVRPVCGRGVAREEAAFRHAVENADRRIVCGQAAQTPVHDGAIVAQNVFHAAFDGDREISLSYASRAYRRSEALTLSTAVHLRRVA